MSKGLEALENVAEDYKDLVIEHYYASDINKNKRNELFYKLDKDFETIKKELKALEIIKNKGVNVWLFCYGYTLTDYDNELKKYAGYYERKLTQEEYELLKEVLL